MKVIYKGIVEHQLLKKGQIYRAELDNDSINGEIFYFYQLYHIESGILYDWCELDDVDILAEIREQNINKILND